MTPLDELDNLLKEHDSQDLKDDVVVMRRIIVEKYGFLHCLGIRNHYSKPKQSSLTLILYVIFMIITMVLLQFSAYPVLRQYNKSQTEEEPYDWILYSSQILYAVSFVFWLIVWLKDPGFLKQDSAMDFVTILGNMDAT